MNDYRKFYNFPSDWSPISLLNSTYLKGRIGWQGLKASEFTTDGPYLVTGTNFVKGRIDWEHCYHITAERFREAPGIHLKESDLLITKDGTIGKVALVKDCPDETTLNSGIFLLRCKDKSYSHPFLYHFLLSDYFKKYLRDTQGGSTIVHLYQREFERFTFRAPEITEQERIAEILSTVDSAIEQTQALINKYGRIERGLMQDLLTRGIDENGDIRSKETHKFSVKNGIEIPDEWEVYEIGDITDRVTSGVTPKGGSSVYGHSGVMLVRSQNVLSGKLALSDVAFISEEINCTMKRSELKAFDVLLNITGASIGRSHFVPESFPVANVNQHVCSIRLTCKSRERSVFLSRYLNSFMGQVQIRRLLGGSNRDGLNFQQIREIKVAMPRIDSNDEFERISSVIDTVDKFVVKTNQSHAKLASLKSGLMKDLLSGRKRVRVHA